MAGRQTRAAKFPLFTLNATFDQIQPEDYDALVVPGGRAPVLKTLAGRQTRAAKFSLNISA